MHCSLRLISMRLLEIPVLCLGSEIHEITFLNYQKSRKTNACSFGSKIHEIMRSSCVFGSFFWKKSMKLLETTLVPLSWAEGTMGS